MPGPDGDAMDAKLGASTAPQVYLEIGPAVPSENEELYEYLLLLRLLFAWSPSLDGAWRKAGEGRL